MKKYIEEWEDAIISETRNGEYGTVHICTNYLLQGEANERQKEKINQTVYEALYRQAYIKQQQSQLI